MTFPGWWYSASGVVFMLLGLHLGLKHGEWDMAFMVCVLGVVHILWANQFGRAGKRP